MAHVPTMTPRTLQEGQGFQVDLVISPPDNVAGEEYLLRPVPAAGSGVVLDVARATVPPFAAGASSTITFQSNRGYPAAGAYSLEIVKMLDPFTVLAAVPVAVTAVALPPLGTPLAASIIGPAAGAVLCGTSNVVMAGAGGRAPYLYVLLVDGTVVYSGPGNTFAWDTAPFANGAHELRLTVQDSAGARARTPRISVNVNNVAVPPAPPRPPPVVPVPGPQVRSGFNWGLSILVFLIPCLIAIGTLAWLWSEVKSGLNEFPKGADPAGVTAPDAASGESINNGPAQRCTFGSTCINNQPPGPAASPVPAGSGGRPPTPSAPPAGSSGIGPAGGWHQWPSPCRLKAGGSC